MPSLRKKTIALAPWSDLRYTSARSTISQQHLWEGKNVFVSIKKRNGVIVPFRPDKITTAIARAGEATGEFDEEAAARLTLRVLNLAQQALPGGVPSVEQIQDIVEEVLLSSQFKRDRQGLHHLPRAARPDQGDRLPRGRGPDRPLPRPGGLAGQRELQHGLFPAGPEQLRLLRDQQDLLAEQDLSPRDPSGAHRRGLPHPRPGDSLGLLRRMGPGGPAHAGLPGRGGQGGEQARAPPAQRPGPGGQLLLHAPGRGGRRAGLLPLRHAARAVHPLRPAGLRRGEAGAAGVRLQHQRAHPRRVPDALHQHHHGPQGARDVHDQARSSRAENTARRPTASSRRRWPSSTAPSSRCFPRATRRAASSRSPFRPTTSPRTSTGTILPWTCSGGSRRGTASPTSPTS